MKTDFRFSNLLGTVYCKGDLLFTPDGICLLSPVGNRVTVFNLVNNKSHTLPFAHRRNITRLALSPEGKLLLTVDEDGRAILSHLPRRLILYHFSFRGPVSALAFSPSGRHFCVGLGRLLEVWHTPTTPETDGLGTIEFAPFVRHRVLAGHYDTIQSVQWSSDSRFFLTSAKDLTARIWSLDPVEGFEPTTLAGHREGVLGAWFSNDQESLYTLSEDGALFRWAYVSKPGVTANSDEHDVHKASDDSQRWRIVDRQYFMQSHAKANCAAYHASSNLLVVGFSNGLFTLHELPDFQLLHNISISQSDIDVVTINSSGEWLAFGSSKLGQLLVWEWQSESYILKQQGHFDSTNAIAYSPDGQRIVTAADDGKVKVWDVESGFCSVTFTEHSGSVTACQFAKRGNVMFTASLDGSIRAWDMVRYRNFRTFVAPTRLSFSCLAVDPSGEVICAGSSDSFDVHLWSVQTGQLLDQLAGHEGPVSSLSFAPNGGSIVSGSWDHTVRVWNVFGRTQTSEPLQLQADILDITIRPDSKQLAVSSLDGQLTFWSIAESSQESGVDGRRDASGGRKLSDRRTAANSPGSKAFRSIAYSADGSCVLAGGNSKYINLYDVQSGVLVKKYTVSINLSIDGTQEYLNSKNLTEAGPAGLIDTQGESSRLEDRIDRTLPGASRGDLSLRKRFPEVRVSAIGFCPTGRAFCAASTEGLLIYSLDHTVTFDPFDLDMNVTPSSTLQMLQDGNFVLSLVMAFRLNENNLIQQIYYRIPVSDIPLVVKGLPVVYLARFFRFFANIADETPHLEFNLRWIEAILRTHGSYLKDNAALFAAELRTAQKIVNRMKSDLATLADQNVYSLEYLLAQLRLQQQQQQPGRTDDVKSGFRGEAMAVDDDDDHDDKDSDLGADGEVEWIGLD